MKLKIVLEQGMDGYIVAYCPALKGCVTQGRTEQDAIENLKSQFQNAPFRPISALDVNFNPRNTLSIPVVEISVPP